MDRGGGQVVNVSSSTYSDDLSLNPTEVCKVAWKERK